MGCKKVNATVASSRFVLSKFLFYPYAFNPTALRKAKIVYNFGPFQCHRVKYGLTKILTIFNNVIGSFYAHRSKIIS